MQRKPVISSNINSIGYDDATLTLEVEFYDQTVWGYSPVTREAYTELMNAESTGSYFARHIRNNKDITSTKIA